MDQDITTISGGVTASFKEERYYTSQKMVISNMPPTLPSLSEQSSTVEKISSNTKRCDYWPEQERKPETDCNYASSEEEYESV